MASPGFAGLEVSARGSPASDCALPFVGLPAGAAVVPGVAPDAAASDPGGAAVEAGCCCAIAVADMAQYRAIKLKRVEVLVMRPPSGAPAPAGAVSPASVPFPVRASVPSSAATLLPAPVRGPMSMRAPVPVLRCACAILPANR